MQIAGMNYQSHYTHSLANLLKQQINQSNWHDLPVRDVVVYAIHNSDMALFQQALEQLPCCCEENGCTTCKKLNEWDANSLVFWTFSGQEVEMCKVLLDKGAEINSIYHSFQSPYDSRDYCKLHDFFSEVGVFPDESAWDQVHIAILRSDQRLFHAALAKLPDSRIDHFCDDPYEIRPWEMHTLLEVALDHGEINMVKDLIARGATLDAIIKDGRCYRDPLIFYEDHPKGIETLIELGANLGIQQCQSGIVSDAVQVLLKKLAWEEYEEDIDIAWIKYKKDIDELRCENIRHCIHLLETSIGHQPYAKDRITTFCNLLRKQWKDAAHYYGDSLIDMLADALDIKIAMAYEKRNSWKRVLQNTNTLPDSIMTENIIFERMFKLLTVEEIDETVNLIESSWQSMGPIRFGELVANLFVPPWKYAFYSTDDPLLYISDSEMFEYLESYPSQESVGLKRL